MERLPCLKRITGSGKSLAQATFGPDTHSPDSKDADIVVGSQLTHEGPPRKLALVANSFGTGLFLRQTGGGRCVERGNQNSLLFGAGITSEHFELISVTAVAHDLGVDLDQFLTQADQRLWLR